MLQTVFRVESLRVSPRLPASKIVGAALAAIHACCISNVIAAEVPTVQYPVCLQRGGLLPQKAYWPSPGVHL